MPFNHLPGSRPLSHAYPRVEYGASGLQFLMHLRTHSLEWRVFLRAGDSSPFYHPYLALAHASRPDELIVFKGESPPLAVHRRHLPRVEQLFYANDGVVELHPSLHMEIPATGRGVELPRSIDRSAYWDAINRLANYMRDYGAPAGWPQLTHRKIAAMSNMATKVLRDRRQADNYRDPRTRWLGVMLSPWQALAVWRMRRDPDWKAAVKEWMVNGSNADEMKEHLENWMEQGVPADVLRALLGKITGLGLVCTYCDHIEWEDIAVTTVGGDTYCEHCANNDLVEVHTMDTPRRQRGWYHREDVYYWASDDAYHLEEEPEEEDDEDPDDYHESCDLLNSWGASTRHLSHDRSFTPSAYGDFTMGVEIEVEVTDAYERNSALRDTDSQLNADRGYAMFKRDGSLSDSRGFEIVTAARRLGDHIDTLREWDPHSDLRAWTTGSCGTHVHIDSRAFTALSLGKFLQLYNDPANKAFIRAIAGRHPDSDSSASSYARRHGTPLTMNPASVKKGAGTTRYHMINLTNLSEPEKRRLKQEATRDCKGDYSTVEVRIFRATLKKERLLAQIEFAHASVAFCRVAGNHQLNGKDFLAWLGTCAGHYRHLARWFGVNLPRPTKQRPTVASAPGLAALAG